MSKKLKAIESTIQPNHKEAEIWVTPTNEDGSKEVKYWNRKKHEWDGCGTSGYKYYKINNFGTTEMPAAPIAKFDTPTSEVITWDATMCKDTVDSLAKGNTFVVAKSFTGVIDFGTSFTYTTPGINEYDVYTGFMIALVPQNNQVLDQLKQLQELGINVFVESTQNSFFEEDDPSYNLFVIYDNNQIAHTYFFDPDMTWRQWIDSKYNTENFILYNNGDVLTMSSQNNAFAWQKDYGATFIRDQGNTVFLYDTIKNKAEYNAGGYIS